MGPFRENGIVVGFAARFIAWEWRRLDGKSSGADAIRVWGRREHRISAIKMLDEIRFRMRAYHLVGRYTMSAPAAQTSSTLYWRLRLRMRAMLSVSCSCVSDERVCEWMLKHFQCCGRASSSECVCIFILHVRTAYAALYSASKRRFIKFTKRLGPFIYCVCVARGLCQPKMCTYLILNRLNANKASRQRAEYIGSWIMDHHVDDDDDNNNNNYEDDGSSIFWWTRSSFGSRM